MDILQAARAYAEGITSCVDGLKMLLLDQDTTSIVSLACSQSFLLSREIYVTDRIDNPNRGISAAQAYPPSTSDLKIEQMPFLHCICVLRPTDESIAFCAQELKEARYGTYHLFFTNALSRKQIEILANADVEEKVFEIKEVYFDFLSLDRFHFSLGILPTPLHPEGVTPFTNSHASDGPLPRTARLYGDRPFTFASGDIKERHISGIVASLLALGKKPTVRYEKFSAMSKSIAEGVSDLIKERKDLWPKASASQEDPVLLVLDRRDDPLTPLLNPWTYEAMIHELLGFNNGRAHLDGQQLVISGQQDPFFSKNKYADFGSLSENLNAAVKEYAEKSSFTDARSIQTLADMKSFVQNYPEFKKMGGNISKHVSLLGAISSIVDKYDLLTVSELEQNLACSANHNQDYYALEELIRTPDVNPALKLRVAFLYALHYEKHLSQQIPTVIRLLKEHNVPGDLVHLILNFAGSQARSPAELFPSQASFLNRNTPVSQTKAILRRIAIEGIAGAALHHDQSDLPEENVYTRHMPLLVNTLEAILKGRLSPEDYPFVETASGSATDPSGEVIIFIVGGTTFQEARCVDLLNEYFSHESKGNMNLPVSPGSGARIILGGTCVLNSSSFLAMMQDACMGQPAQSLLMRHTVTHQQEASIPRPFDTATIGQTVDEAKDSFGRFIDRVRGF